MSEERAKEDPSSDDGPLEMSSLENSDVNAPSEEKDLEKIESSLPNEKDNKVIVKDSGDQNVIFIYRLCMSYASVILMKAVLLLAVISVWYMFHIKDTSLKPDDVTKGMLAVGTAMHGKIITTLGAEQQFYARKLNVLPTDDPMEVARIYMKEEDISRLNISTLEESVVGEKKQYTGCPHIDYFETSKKRSSAIFERHGGGNLWKAKYLSSICKLSASIFSELLSEKEGHSKCNLMVSPGSFIAEYQGISCEDLNDNSLLEAYTVLNKCSPKDVPFLKKYETDECSEKELKFSYSFIRFFVDTGFRESFKPDSVEIVLKYAKVFFLNTDKSDTLPFYRENKYLFSKTDGLTQIVALDFPNVKLALYEESIQTDLHISVAYFFILFIILAVFTKSIFVSTIQILVFGCSLTFSMITYFYIYKIDRFSFLSMFAVTAFQFILVQNIILLQTVWKRRKEEIASDSNKKLAFIFSSTVKLTYKSSLFSFIVSFISFLSFLCCPIIDGKLLGIFTATHIGFSFLTYILLSPGIIFIRESINECLRKNNKSLNRCSVTTLCTGIMNFFNSTIVRFCYKFKYYIVFLSAVLTAISLFIVSYEPGLRFSDVETIKSFGMNNKLERFEAQLYNEFYPELQLPMQIYYIFGLKPISNSNPLDPDDMGTRVFDDKFDFFAKDTQVYLRRLQDFLSTEDFYKGYVHNTSLLFWNAVDFVMSRPCDMKIELNGEVFILPTCCGQPSFPFEPEILKKCLPLIVFLRVYLYDISNERFDTFYYGHPVWHEGELKGYGIGGFVDINFSFSYNKMKAIYEKVEKIKDYERIYLPPNIIEYEKVKVPEGLENGFVIGEFHYMDIQNQLIPTMLKISAITLSISFLLSFLLFRNVYLSFLLILMSFFSLICTLAILVICLWKIQIPETFLICTLIALNPVALSFFTNKYFLFQSKPFCVPYLKSTTLVNESFFYNAIVVFSIAFSSIPVFFTTTLTTFMFAVFLLVSSAVIFVVGCIFLNSYLLLTGSS